MSNTYEPYMIDGEIGVVVGVPVEIHERYTGEYDFTPSLTDQTIECSDLIMSDDITVEAVPYTETANTGGGITIEIL